MNPDKLEALRNLALDERTPLEEARTAALTFVRKGGRAEPDDKTHMRLVILEGERDNARAEAQKHKAEAERLRLLLGKMLALADAEKKLDKNRAEVEAEVRRAVGQEPTQRNQTEHSPGCCCPRCQEELVGRARAQQSRPTSSWGTDFTPDFVQEFMRQQTRRRY